MSCGLLRRSACRRCGFEEQDGGTRSMRRMATHRSQRGGGGVAESRGEGVMAWSRRGWGNNERFLDLPVRLVVEIFMHPPSRSSTIQGVAESAELARHGLCQVRKHDGRKGQEMAANVTVCMRCYEKELLNCFKE